MRLALIAFAASVALAAACSDDPGAADGGRDATAFISGDASTAEDSGAADAGLDAGVEPDANLDAGAADGAALDADICATEPVEVLTATAARARAGELAGLVVALTGTATRTALDCTERACPEEDPCCNDCTARIVVGEVFLAASECYASEPRCAGNECNQTCRPPLFGLPQTFKGVLSTSTPDLELLLYEIR